MALLAAMQQQDRGDNALRVAMALEQQQAHEQQQEQEPMDADDDA
jgi:hypothetical protein